jgi:SAM-dependent methyltransferase
MSRHHRARRGRLVTQVVSIVAVAAMVSVTILILRGTSRAPDHGSSAAPGESTTTAARSYIPYGDAASLIDALASHAPSELRNRAPSERALQWDGWVARHDARIRARLEAGDEDSAVNFWLYGTTFTARPRATSRDLARLGSGAAAEDLLIDRLDDLVAAVATPGANERLSFVRRVLERRGIDPTTADGQQRARIFLVETRERAMAERANYKLALGPGVPGTDESSAGAYSTLYRDRGLSSDTSLAAAFALDRALGEMASSGRLGPGSVARVAIVGPGLDFTDKAEGYDFYPVQTIHPFAIADSLLRTGLARAGALQVTTFDLSPRVNQHLEAARDRARSRTPYVLQLPLAQDDPARDWHPDLVAYWQRFGDAVGAEVLPLPAPPGAGQVRMRAVEVRPDVVGAIAPVDLNIVLQRLDERSPADRFDLIIATNVLVYYDPFEQALAMANISRMLRPGGFLLSNYALSPTPPFEPTAGLVTKVFWDRQSNGDTLFGYRRR